MWHNNTDEQIPTDADSMVRIKLRNGDEYNGRAGDFHWTIHDRGDDILRWQPVESGISFEDMCKLLPEDVYWGSELQPHILREILLAYTNREQIKPKTSRGLKWEF